MKRSKWSVVVCIVALLGVTACSDSDEVVNLPVSQQAAAAIESAFVDVVLPLSDFVSGMADAIAAGQPKAPSLECPSSEGVCSSGSVTCDADSSGIGLDFDFDNCNLTEAMIVADGALNFTPTGASSFVVTLNGFSLDGGSPNAVDYIKRGKIDLVINIPKHFQKEELTNDYIIRRTAADFGVPLITNRQLAERLAEALDRIPIADLRVWSWSRYAQ